MINILIICNKTFSEEQRLHFLYFKLLLINLYLDPIINEEYVRYPEKKYDLIFLNNCNSSVSDELISELPDILNENGIIYFSNLNKTREPFGDLRKIPIMDTTVPNDIISYYNLEKHLADIFSKILTELSTTPPKKISCWAWWAFPTALTGNAEPPPASRITQDTLPLLLTNYEFMTIHRQLDKLLKNGNKIKDIFPRVDYGRIQYFCEFMNSNQIKIMPSWFKNYMVLLTQQANEL